MAVNAAVSQVRGSLPCMMAKAVVAAISSRGMARRRVASGDERFALVIIVPLGDGKGGGRFRLPPALLAYSKADMRAVAAWRPIAAVAVAVVCAT